MCWIVMMRKLNVEVSKVDVKVSAIWIIILSIRIYPLSVGWSLWLFVEFLKKK